MLEKLKKALSSNNFEEEAVNKIVDVLKSEKIFLASEENLDTRYTKLKDQKKALEETLKTLESDNKALSEKIDSNDISGLEKDLEEWKGKFETLTKQREEEHKELYLKELVTNLQGKDFKVIKSLLDVEGVKADEQGNYTGGEDMVNNLKESYPYLFGGEEQVKENPTPVITNGNNPQNELKVDKDPWKEAFSQKYGD